MTVRFGLEKLTARKDFPVSLPKEFLSLFKIIKSDWYTVILWNNQIQPQEMNIIELANVLPLSLVRNTLHIVVNMHTHIETETKFHKTLVIL